MQRGVLLLHHRLAIILNVTYIVAINLFTGENMQDTIMYAKYNQAANKTVYHLLSKMSNDDREKNRESFYGSLSDLFRHVIGGTKYFLGLYKTALTSNASAMKILSALDGIKVPEGPLSQAQWKELESAVETADSVYVAMAESLRESDMKLPLAIDWYGGNPDSVPLSFMLSQLLVHNTHHRGQISQILDSLKIENDFSGIDISLLIK
jgi:uncharacterized damage-inducible protein DinB